MSPLLHAGCAGLHGFPRVSGDEPSQLVVQPGRLSFSPRERG